MIYRHALLFEDIGGEYNIPLAENARTVRDFDEGLTRGIYFGISYPYLKFVSQVKTADIFIEILQFHLVSNQQMITTLTLQAQILLNMFAHPCSVFRYIKLYHLYTHRFFL